MKQRRIAAALIVLLCMTALLSGALLILHTGHDCRQSACPVCMILAQNTESFLCLPVVFAGAGLICSGGRYCLYWCAEDRFVPDWTLVRRKVKLQD